MRNLKKFLAAAVAAVTLTAALCLGASAAKFTDVNAKDEVLSEAVDLLTYLNVTKGTSETTFGTNENVTRQQMAAFIYRLMKKGASMEGGENTSTFKDLEDSTYFAYVSWANAMGIIKGRTSTTFDPKGTINLQEAYTMVIRALGYDDSGYMFPIDYIDLAEAKGVELDEGIPSGFSYETPLTRGAVAIILYNAFFAETGETKVKHVERTLAEGTPAQSQVLIEKEYNPTLAETVYDVIQGDFQVVATPKNAFNKAKGNTEYTPLLDEFEDVDMLQFAALEAGEKLESFYYDFDKLNLSGKADDYIMGIFEVFYTVDKDGAISKVFYAGNSMSHESTTDVKMTKIAAKSSRPEDYYEYYFTNGQTKNGGNEIHHPYLTVAGKKIYLFNAPYSYIKPNYGSYTDEVSLYALRNEKNAKLIGVELLDGEDGTYSYYIKDSFAKDDYVKFIDTFHQVASGGLTKCDIYDVDGDEIYDYIRYRPYMFGKMDGDESEVFGYVTEHASNAAVDVTNKDAHANRINNVPTIYYNEANLTGAKFNEGDFVIAHLDVETNEIDVLKVADKAQGVVSGINYDNKQFTLNGKSYSCLSPGKLLENFNVGGVDDYDTSHAKPSYDYDEHQYYHTHMFSSAALNNEYVLYLHGNVVLFYEPASEGNAVYSRDNLIIPLKAGQHDEINNPGFLTPNFDFNIGDDVYYLKAWIDGKVKFVPVTIDDMYPRPERYGDTRNFNVAKDSKGNEYDAYLGKICSYTIDKYGIYHLTSLLYSRDEDTNKYNGISRDAAILVDEGNSSYFANDLGSKNVMIKKVVTDRYKLVASDGTTSLLGDTDTGSFDDGHPGEDATLSVDYMMFTEATTIIIRNEKANVSSTKFEDKYEYLEFDAETFLDSVAVTKDSLGNDMYLTNVQYVLRGDPDNNDRAYLEFLYAEAYDFTFVSKKAEQNERILLSVSPSSDDKGYYYNAYDIYNPYTGETVKGVAGTKTFAESKNITVPFATIAGRIVKINADGKIDEADTTSKEIVIANNTSNNLGFIEDFSKEELTIELSPINATEYPDGPYYELAEDTPVILVKYAEGSTDFYKAELTALTVADLGSDKKDYKCYNDKYRKNSSGTYITDYAKKIKCYVDYEPAKKTDELPTVNFVLVIVHDNEASAYLDLPATVPTT